MTRTAKRHWFSSILRAALVPLVKSERELAFEAELQGRTLMDDETFYQSNYGSTSIPREIPLRLRTLIVHQLGRELSASSPPTNQRMAVMSSILPSSFTTLKRSLASQFH